MAAGGSVKSAPQSKVGARRAAADAAHAVPAASDLRPLAPRKRLLAVLSLLFAAWMVFLVVLYFTTIYPRRSVAPDDTLSAAPLRLASAHGPNPGR